MHSDKDLRCRVCGYRSEEPPWGEDGRTPLYDFCPCCGVEHGYQDSSTTGARTYRAKWLSAGALWDRPAVKPENWVLAEQLGQVPPEFK